ncbi:PD-(D/E)XK motif protein [Actinacidiphila glaucinigra]|uniref:PD-(D/E)XK motif protein n=1 Tax=Actinacidiphila glaucinigra TaxID=235986 RepID=UPI003825BC22
MTEREGSPELPWSTVEHYLGEGLAASYRLSGAVAGPLVSYEIGAGGRDIALYVELDRHRRPPRSRMPAVQIDQVAHHGRRMARIHTSQVTLMRDFHDLLMAVADRIVTAGRHLDDAFEQTIQGWSELLEQPGGMAARKRLGLHGELAVLRAVAERNGWASALDAWVGPQGEEHDFALADGDLEVKTTASEERRHTIHGVGQLDETPGRPLWFVSLRLTRGGAAGRTLGDSVRAVRDAAAAESVAAARQLDLALAASGWRDDVADDERWTPRDGPLVLRGDAMPRLRADMSPPDAVERVSSVRYDVDVTGLPPAEQPPLDLTDLRLP